MTAGEAAALAARWTAERGARLPGLKGAYLSGSILTAEEGSDWPASSDVDLMLVFEAGACPKNPGKFRWNGVLLEASCLPETEFSPLEQVLSTHYLAYALNAGRILYDPEGFLQRLHRETEARYARRRWVKARCGTFYTRIRQGVQGFDPTASLAAKVMGWAFPTGLTCFPILAAALCNCTVRKRYPAARAVLERYGMEDFYPRLQGLLVPRPLGRERLLRHWSRLEQTFTAACGTTGPSAEYAFRADISREGADVALGGSRELICSSCSEDAVFWMLATFARCHTILDLDAPVLSREREPAFRAFLGDLEIRDDTDFSNRLQALAAFLPELEQAEETMLEKREQAG